MTEGQTVCVCTDMMWVVQIFVDGELLDERLIDCDQPTAETEMGEASRAHMLTFQEARVRGRRARLKAFCPACGGGDLYDTQHGHKVIKPGEKPQMLHILGHARPSDYLAEERGPVFEAMCGHDCVATPPTHELMKDKDFEHVTHCFSCFSRETD